MNRGSIVIIYYKEYGRTKILIGDESKYVSDTFYRGNPTNNIISKSLVNDYIASLIETYETYPYEDIEGAKRYFEKHAGLLERIINENTKNKEKRIEIKYDGFHVKDGMIRTKYRFNRRYIDSPSVGFIKGGREGNETLEQTVQREAREEIGFDLIEKRLVYKNNTIGEYALYYYEITKIESKEIIKNFQKKGKQGELFDLRFIDLYAVHLDSLNSKSTKALKYFKRWL